VRAPLYKRHWRLQAIESRACAQDPGASFGLHAPTEKIGDAPSTVIGGLGQDGEPLVALYSCGADEIGALPFQIGHSIPPEGWTPCHAGERDEDYRDEDTRNLDVDDWEDDPLAGDREASHGLQQGLGVDSA
jgi:hypothetical protein